MPGGGLDPSGCELNSRAPQLPQPAPELQCRAWVSESTPADPLSQAHGGGDIWRRGCALLSGGVAMPGFWPEGPLQGGDAGESQQCGRTSRTPGLEA